MNAVNFEYRVLGYVSADSEALVRPFWVVLKMPDYIRSYILKDLSTELGNIDWIAEEYLEDLLFEIRNQSAESREGAEVVFAGIAEMDSGPLRTVASGFVPEHEPEVEAAFSKTQFSIECSREEIDALLSALRTSFRCLEGVAYG